MSLGPSPSSELQFSKLPIQTADGLGKVKDKREGELKTVCAGLSLIGREKARDTEQAPYLVAREGRQLGI